MNRLIYNFFITFLVAGISTVRSQNLVLNPSFEARTSCPTNFSQLEFAKFWNPAGQTPDYLHLCGFYGIPTMYNPPVKPFDGEAITSLIIAAPLNFYLDTVAREFMQGQFVQPLDNTYYFVSAQILAAPLNRTRNLNILFTENDVGDIGAYPQNLTPQITWNNDWLGDYGAWKQHCSCTDQVAGAQYFTIGNFSPPLSDTLETSQGGPGFLNYIYLDNIEVRKPQAVFEQDSLIFMDACIDLPAVYEHIPYVYVLGQDTITSFCAAAAGNYEILQYPKNCDRPFRLHVNVVETSCDVFVPNIFSPDAEGENGHLQPYLGDSEFGEITDFRIWDRWGGLVYVYSASSPWWDGKNRSKTAQQGVYFYRLSYNCIADGIVRNAVKTGDITLIR